MGSVDVDKEDVISECVRQLEDIKTYLEKNGGNVKKYCYGSLK